MTRVELSFIVPAFNAEATLGETLDSLLSQELSLPWEIVVVDDGSTDGTRALIDEYRRRHPQIVCARNHENQGIGPSRNRAISLTRSDLLYPVDADNVLPPGLAARLVETLRGQDVQAVSVEMVSFFADDRRTTTGGWEMAHTGYRSGVGEALRTIRVPASHGNYVFTRALFEECGGYEPGPLEAWRFGLGHLLSGYEVAIAPGEQYFHRVGHASNWVRDELAGRNDVAALAFFERERARLPADVSRKLDLLGPGDPVVQYLEAGRFAPGGRLPEERRRRLFRRR